MYGSLALILMLLMTIILDCYVAVCAVCYIVFSLVCDDNNNIMVNIFLVFYQQLSQHVRCKVDPIKAWNAGMLKYYFLQREFG